MAVNIRLACERHKQSTSGQEELSHLVAPGDIISADPDFMRGHGTYFKGDKLYASVAGVVERVNKLVSVRPLKTRYNGEIGDCIIGRITEVQQRRWKVDTNSRLDSILHLSSVNLPGGELRRRSAEDELMMRQYLQEGDLISAEVQSVHSDGSLSLHARSLKYGKLSQGTLVKVSPSLIKRRKTHFHNLPCGATVILGNNGLIWISPIINEDPEGGSSFFQSLDPISKADREVMARLRNCILILATNKIMLFDTSILHAFENSSMFEAKELLIPKNMHTIADLTMQKLRLEQFL